jgi:hypothetical protein
MFSYDALLDWAISGERVMRDGPLRAAGLIERLTAGEIEAQVSSVGEGGEADGLLRRRAVQLGAAVFAISLAVSLTGEQASLGPNRFTAEILFIGVAATLLLRAVRRLA